MFSDVSAAISEAVWLADTTGVTHLLIALPDGYLTVVARGELFTGRVLEIFHPSA